MAKAVHSDLWHSSDLFNGQLLRTSMFFVINAIGFKIKDVDF